MINGKIVRALDVGYGNVKFVKKHEFIEDMVSCDIASCLVANRLPCNLPTFKLSHKLSVGALPQQSPLRLIEGLMLNLVSSI